MNWTRASLPVCADIVSLLQSRYTITLLTLYGWSIRIIMLASLLHPMDYQYLQMQETHDYSCCAASACPRRKQLLHIGWNILTHSTPTISDPMLLMTLHDPVVKSHMLDAGSLQRYCVTTFCHDSLGWILAKVAVLSLQVRFGA